MDTGCVVASTPSAPRLDVMLLEPVDPAHAPVPHNAAERLVFAQLYDTLVRVDCRGALMPGLAESWSPLPDGSWTFRLRPDAHFADGAPVTASAVVEAWGASAHAPAFEWVSAVHARELRIVPVDPVADARAFAHPSLAIARDAESSWPIGTGAYRAQLEADGVVLLLRQAALMSAPDTIALDRIDSDDPRHALDRGSDVIVTGDAAAVAYARALSNYDVARLPWSRTYALVVGATADEAFAVPDSVRAALALDAAPGGTRAAAQPRARDLECARDGQSRPPPGARQPAIVYQHGDAVGRNLAERLTALAWPDDRVPAWLDDLLPDLPGSRALRAIGLEPRSLAQGLASDNYVAYVVSLPLTTGASCMADALDPMVRALVDRGDFAGHRIVPLIDAHDFLVWRNGIGMVRVDAHGTIRFGGE